MRKHIANTITGIRIFCSILMAAFSVFSVGFWITYVICGSSDIADGIAARKIAGTSEFGEKFDTVADFVFMLVALIKLLPLMQIRIWIQVWIVTIALIKIANIVVGWIRKKKFAACHTVLNKITGVLLFLLPLALYFDVSGYYLVFVCALAMAAAIHEGYLILKT